jgi:hypothetical protein
MADESLKHLYESIEAEEPEMEHYRARLAPRLCKPRRFRFLFPFGIAATAVVALLIFLVVPRHNDFSQLTLDQIRMLAIHGSPDQISKVKELIRYSSGNARWNETLFLSLTETQGRAMQYATRGIQEDPRPEFRSAYIEFFLDNEDGHRFSMSEVESMMDREYDNTCLYLFRELVKVTRMQERYLGPLNEQDEG